MDPDTPGQYTDKALGSEIDLSFRVNILEDVYLQGGYAFMLPSHTLEILQGTGIDKSEFSSWCWLMLTVKPMLYGQNN